MSVQFVAEVSSNHNRNLKRSLQFIETAARVGCSAVKFQLFKIDKLFAPQILEKSEIHRKRKDWELPLEFIPVLSKRCRDLNIKFSCTPFYIDAVEELKPYVHFYKIASYELLWHALIKDCIKTKLPIVISTGMATIEEIDSVIELFKFSERKDVTLLHCVSGYPVPMEACNLAAIKALRDRYKCSVGWSDHSVCDEVIYRAIGKWGASMIEFHMDLDRKGEEFSSGHCWLPDQIAPVIEKVKTATLEMKEDKTADGSGIKQPAGIELEERAWRADSSDGLRPVMKERESWKNR